jgi:hypothetical protein
LPKIAVIITAIAVKLTATYAGYRKNIWIKD